MSSKHIVNCARGFQQRNTGTVSHTVSLVSTPQGACKQCSAYQRETNSCKPKL